MFRSENGEYVTEYAELSFALYFSPTWPGWVLRWAGPGIEGGNQAVWPEMPTLDELKMKVEERLGVS